jgi:hypothetical protein
MYVCRAETSSGEALEALSLPLTVIWQHMPYLMEREGKRMKDMHACASMGAG